LRSFTRQEADLFFGRKSAVDEMVGRLASTRFLAVIGPSGCGKSSLVNAGLIEALETGLMHRAGARWRIADLRPGSRPLSDLAEALVRSGAADRRAPADADEVIRLRPFVGQGPRAVLEWCKAGNLAPRTNLLLLVDEFEELFRQNADGADEVEAFVAALLASAAAPLEEARIYVVVTMRSEYLGAAASIGGLAEAIDKGHYLAPRMSRNQLRRTITGPASVCGFEVEPELVDRLLSDLAAFAPWEDADAGHQLARLARRADQLPLLQHALSLLWAIADVRDVSGKPVLKLSDYDALGGLRAALATHGREILEELLPEHRSVAPLVFRALTAGSSLAEAVRHPTTFGELVEIAHGDEIAVREIVEAFRAPGRNFLTPPRPEPLGSTTRIDIVHESFIRQWDVFGSWLRQEIASAAAWRRLAALAERHRQGEGDLLSGAALASLADWWEGERPAPRWAERYGGDFDMARTFLEESRRTEAASMRAAAERGDRRVRGRLLAFAAVVAICIVTPLAFFAGHSAIRANAEAEHARLAAAAADDARNFAEAERQAAEIERQVAEAERRRADAEMARAEDERQRAAAEARRADEEKQRTLAARSEAEAAVQLTESEKERTEQERLRALAAIEQATAAGVERDRAEAERREAAATRNEAVRAARLAQAKVEEAEQLRQLALAGRQEAIHQAEAADKARREAIEQAESANAARDVAVEERQQAVAAREEAEATAARAEEARRAAVDQAEITETARGAADEERQQAVVARQEAEAIAARAEELADQERLRALAAIDQARAAEADLQRANEELARARAAVEAAQAERDQAELERRRALASQSQSTESSTADPVTE
jgi:hypothetical protein